MRTKYCMMLLSLLLILPISIQAADKKKRKIVLANKTLSSNTVTRIPSTFDVNVEEVDNTLQIVFTGSLPDAEIRLTDKDDIVVVQEGPTLIYEGMTLYAPAPTGYPYLLEVESPTLKMTGEIVLEEY